MQKDCNPPEPTQRAMHAAVGWLAETAAGADGEQRAHDWMSGTSLTCHCSAPAVVDGRNASASASETGNENAARRIGNVHGDAR